MRSNGSDGADTESKPDASKESTAPNRRLVALAALELLFVRASLLTLGYRTTARLVAVVTPPPAWVVGSRLHPKNHPDPRSVADAVEAAVDRTPVVTNCLVKAVACKALLDRCGVETDLRVGVAKADERLQAHAWLVHRGDVLVGGTDDDPTRYRRLVDSLEP